MQAQSHASFVFSRNSDTIFFKKWMYGMYGCRNLYGFDFGIDATKVMGRQKWQTHIMKSRVWVGHTLMETLQ